LLRSRRSPKTALRHQLPFDAFKDIPYVAPPAGGLRWSEPAPPVPREGVRSGGVNAAFQEARSGFLENMTFENSR
jgi:carboxylesterase type B